MGQDYSLEEIAELKTSIMAEIDLLKADVEDMHAAMDYADLKSEISGLREIQKAIDFCLKRREEPSGSSQQEASDQRVSIHAKLQEKSVIVEQEKEAIARRQAEQRESQDNHRNRRRGGDAL